MTKRGQTAHSGIPGKGMERAREGDRKWGDTAPRTSRRDQFRVGKGELSALGPRRSALLRAGSEIAGCGPRTKWHKTLCPASLRSGKDAQGCSWGAALTIRKDSATGGWAVGALEGLAITIRDLPHPGVAISGARQ